MRALIYSIACLMFFMPVFAAGDTAHARTALDDITFPETGWDADLLGLIESGPRFLSPDFDTGVKAPPMNSAAQTRAELDKLLQLQGVESRNAVNLALIHAENRFDLVQMIFRDKGIIPGPADAPNLHKLLRMVDEDVGFFILRDKKRFNRARPTQLEDKLQTVIKVPGHPSYPSGHAGQSQALGLVLAVLDPQRESFYRTLANDIGIRREIAGVHYQSDSIAGQILAHAVVSALLELDEIKAMLPQAKAELIRHHTDHTAAQ